MRRETPDLMLYPFMEELGIKAIEIDPATMDLSPEFRERLKKLLKSGWRADQRLVIAKSKDPRLDGEIVNGRHRCWAVGELLEEGYPFDVSKILYSLEPVKTADDLRTIRAACEDASSTQKQSQKSRAWIKSNISKVVKNNFNSQDKSHVKVLDYLRSKGFTNDDLSIEIINDYLNSLQKKADRRKQKKDGRGSPPPIPAHLREGWGGAGPAPIVEENSTTYYREVPVVCERCAKTTTAKINIIVSDDAKTVKALPVLAAVSR